MYSANEGTGDKAPHHVWRITYRALIADNVPQVVAFEEHPGRKGNP